MSKSMAMSPASLKIVQNLKEIVNRPEAEIYTALKDCDMDPYEAVSRLLTQDSFQEVKRKREKKKEGKGDEITFRGSSNNGSSRGNRSGADRYTERGGSTHYTTPAESSSMHGRTNGKGNGTTGYTSYILPLSDASGYNKNNAPYGHSNGSVSENERLVLGKADSMTYVVQSTPVHQSSLTGVPGQLTMADIVKMGSSHSKVSNGQVTCDFSSHGFNNLISDEDQGRESHHHGDSSFQHVSANSDWPPLEKPASGELISDPEDSIDSKTHPEEYIVPDDGTEMEKVGESKEGITEISETNYLVSNNCSSKKIPRNASRGASLFVNELHRNMGLSQPLAYDIEHHGVERHGDSVAVATENLLRLSLGINDRKLPSDEDEPSVIIPDHLQAQTAGCPHLSFGTFQPDKSSTYSPGMETSVAIQKDLEDGPSNKDDISLADYADIKRPSKLCADYDYASDRSLFHGSVTPEGIYDLAVASRPEELNRFSFPSSIHDNSYDDSRSVNATLSQTSSHMLNYALPSNLLRSYTKPVSSSVLAANAQLGREPDAKYKQYPTSQSISANYDNALPAVGGATISMAEALKAAGIHNPRTTGPPLPQHLDLQSFEPYADTIDCSLPQSHAYMPSDFKQTSAAYLQSLAARIPQYNKTSGSLPQRGSGFGSATSVLQDHLMDLPTSISGRSLRYDDLLSSPYDDYGRLLSLHQNESSADWLLRHNSRTTPSVMSLAHDDRQRQMADFRQSQDYIVPGYLSRNGSSLLDHQQYLSDLLHRSSQGQNRHSQMWPQY